MTEWAVVGVIVVMIGLIGAIVKPLIKWNTSLTENTMAIKGLTDSIKGNEQINTEEHNALWCVCDKQGEKLNEHDTRITVLEKEKGGAK